MAARWTYYTEGDYSGGGIQYLVNQETQGESRHNSITALKKGLKSTFKMYSKTKTKVIVMLQVPMQESSPRSIYYSSLISGKLNQELLKKNL